MSFALSGIQRWGTFAEAVPSQLRPSSVEKLHDEVEFARGKFPGNRLLLAALTEEVGELARALLQRKGNAEISREALQVACVAMRIYEEGDATFEKVSDEEALP